MVVNTVIEHSTVSFWNIQTLLLDTYFLFFNTDVCLGISVPICIAPCPLSACTQDSLGKTKYPRTFCPFLYSLDPYRITKLGICFRFSVKNTIKRVYIFSSLECVKFTHASGVDHAIFWYKLLFTTKPLKTF